MAASPSPGPLQALLRGARRRCPRCGEGRLFARWFTLHERCGACALQFEAAAGDTWGFWVVMDRLFLLAAMVLLFFGFRPTTWQGRTLFLLGVAIPLIATMPHRQGIATALDYLLRRPERGQTPSDRTIHGPRSGSGSV